jgi:putative DNA methylase
VTDPPYYDNVPYADISDFFYVWLRRCLGKHFPEHFAAVLTPKKPELTALSARHDGDMAAANKEYEQRMSLALAEAGRVLKHGGQIVIVYAHKTTLGWVTLVEALRQRLALSPQCGFASSGRGNPTSSGKNLLSSLRWQRRLLGGK